MQAVKTVEEALKELKNISSDGCIMRSGVTTTEDWLIADYNNLVKKAQNLINSLEAARSPYKGNVKEAGWVDMSKPEPKIDMKYSDHYNSQTFANPDRSPPNLGTELYSEEVKSIWKPVSHYPQEEDIIIKDNNHFILGRFDEDGEFIDIVGNTYPEGVFGNNNMASLSDYINSIEERLTKLEEK